MCDTWPVTRNEHNRRRQEITDVPWYLSRRLRQRFAPSFHVMQSEKTRYKRTAHTRATTKSTSRVFYSCSSSPGRLLLRDDIRFHRTQHGQQCVLVCRRNAGRVKRLHEILDQRIEVGAG